MVEAFAGSVADLGVQGATLMLATDWLLHPATHVVIADDGSREADAMRTVARTCYRPRKVITTLTESDDATVVPEPVRAMLDGKAPRAYVCSGPQCELPVETAEELMETLHA